MTFDGGRLREAREALKMTQADFADAIRVSVRSLQRFEQGRSPKARNMNAIAVVTGRDPQWFYGADAHVGVPEELREAATQIAAMLTAALVQAVERQRDRERMVENEQVAA